MYTAEVEKSHVEIHGGAQMFQRLAKAKAQARKAAKVRPHAQVGAFDVASADSFKLRMSADAYWDGRCYFRGVVPLRAFAISRSVEFEQLGEVNVRSEVFFDGRNVAAKSVRRDLESPSDPLAQILDEIVRAGTFALCNQIRQNHFCFAVDCHPDVLVAPFFRNVAVQMGFFGVNEGPEFIGLNEVRTDVPNFLGEKTSGLTPNREKQRENRALVDASGAGHSADAHSFEQERDDLRGLLRRYVMASKRPFARFGECGFAGGAAETLDSVVSVESEPFYFGVLTSDARHFRPCLSCRASRKCFLWSALRLTPRADLAPSGVDAPGGVFLFRFRCVQSGRRPRNKHIAKLRWRDRVCHISLAVANHSSGTNLVFLLKPSQNCVDRRQHVPILRQVEAHLLKSCPDTDCIHLSIGGRSKSLSDGVGQTDCVLSDVFLAQHTRERRGDLLQMGQLRCQLILFLHGSAKLSSCRSNLLLELFQQFCGVN